MLPPRPSIATGCCAGLIMSSRSSPRVHTGTITGSRRVSKPSFFISASAHSMARSRFCEPLSR
jgi:hypothetical protein